MSNKKTLIMLTDQYPFGNGEAFVEDELRVAEHSYARIVLISCDTTGRDTGRYVPSNARIIRVRKKRYEIWPMLCAAAAMLMPESWKELQRLKKNSHPEAKGNIYKKLFTTHYICLLLKRIFRKEKWWKTAEGDKVFYSYWLSDGAAFLARNRKKLKGICVSRAHGVDCFDSRGYHLFRDVQFEKLDGIFPISQAGTEDLCRQGCEPGKVHTARIGILKTGECRNPVGENGAFHIVTCSNVIALKRLDLLIDALADIRDIPIVWNHFGTGDLMEQMQSYAKQKLGDMPNIQYTYFGQVPKERILRYYESTPVDLFINCSDAEGIPVSVMEAMAHEIPAVARNVGGNGEIVEDGVNGLLLPTACTPNELADAIRSVYEMSQQEKTVMRQAAYQTYESKYSAEKNYSAFISMIQEVAQ
ncbi:MAG: glycosyltransferase [Ruminococcaceae bacterium]|nr:glycosyltransferase [Oscillospiraceae bacterium]